MNDLRVRAMFENSRHNIVSIFLISPDYYVLPERTVRAFGHISDILKPNKFIDVQNLYQDKASMDMTIKEFIFLTVLVGMKNINHSPLI